MTDEENKAIEYWKTQMEIIHWNTQLASEYYMKILLELIEKQQKEIELLKEENEKYKNPPFFDEDNYTENDKIKAKIKELEKLNDEATGIGYGFAIYYLQSLLQEGENNEC